MASAMMVWSELEKPLAAANSRPFWRAVTMSASCWMGTCTSVVTIATPRRQFVDVGQPFFQIEGGGDAVQGQPELDHRQCHVRLNAHHDRHRPSQPGGLRDSS